MLNCEWIHTLTEYHCTAVRGIHGEAGVRIATPFCLPDEIAINIYLLEVGDEFLFSDNGDTLFHLSTLRLDLLPHHHSELCELVRAQGVTLDEDGDFRIPSQQKHAEWNFVRLIAALLAVGQWAETRPPVAAETNRHAQVGFLAK